MPWFSGDLHRHSLYSSALYGGDDDAPDSLLDIRQNLIEKGMSFGACSDHHNILNHSAWLSLETDSFLPFISKEISTGRGHVMALNATEDVRFEPAGDSEDDLRDAFIRMCGRIRACGGIAQLNHPVDRKPSLALPRALYDILPHFDMFELWNGSEAMAPGTKNGDAFALWQTLLRQGIYLPATTGSDRHRIDESKPEREIRTVVHAQEFTRSGILSALRAGNSYLTNGPQVDIRADGHAYGETVTHAGRVSLNVSISCLHDIHEWTLHLDGHPPRRFEAGSLSPAEQMSLQVDDARWMFFTVGSGPECHAITNPIFLKRG